MELFVSLIIIVFGILQIVLFFKLWGMTNDIRRLTEHICVTSQEQQLENKKQEKEEVKEYDPRLDTIKPGDKVESIFDGRELIVDSIKNGKLFCKTGSFSGYKYYEKNEVKYIE